MKHRRLVMTATKITLLCFRSLQAVLFVSKTKVTVTGSEGCTAVKYLGTVSDNKLAFETQVDAEQICSLGKLTVLMFMFFCNNVEFTVFI